MRRSWLKFKTPPVCVVAFLSLLTCLGVAGMGGGSGFVILLTNANHTLVLRNVHCFQFGRNSLVLTDETIPVQYFKTFRARPGAELDFEGEETSPQKNCPIHIFVKLSSKLCL